MENETGPLRAEELSRIASALFLAATGDAGWNHFLERVSSVSGGVCTHMFGFDCQAGIAEAAAYSGYDPAWIKIYDEYYQSMNPWAAGLIRHPAGVPVDCEAMCPSEEVLKTEFYNDWLRPQGDISQGGGALLFSSKSRFFALGGNIRRKDADRLKPQWLQIVGQLIPHMQQAFEISRALAGVRLETAIVARYGLRDVPGFVLSSESGFVLFANQMAEEMLQRGQPIATDIGGRLSFGAGQAAGTTIGEILRYKLTPGSPSFAARVPASAGEPAYRLRFARLASDIEVPGTLSLTSVTDRHYVLVLIEPEQSTHSLASQLQALHGLTLAEAEVALAIAEGFTIREIADLRAVSTLTVRHQVKVVIGKLGVRRQADIVRVVLTLPLPT